VENRRTKRGNGCVAGTGHEAADPKTGNELTARPQEAIRLTDAHDFRNVPVAGGFVARLLGLVGKRELFLFIPRCTAVHTLFMRGAIDLVWVDERSSVTGIKRHAGPWRVFFGPRGTRSVLELPPGHAARIGMAAGDRVMLRQPGEEK
jgi:uncharacterized membrane protein (UPF0127 family)